MFRLSAPCALFAGAMLFAGSVLAQQRLPTIAPEQYTAEQKKITGGTGTLARINGMARTSTYANPRAGVNETQIDIEYWLPR
jgi:hypothetical protein